MKDDGLSAYAPRSSGSKLEQVQYLLSRRVSVEIDRVGGPHVKAESTLPRVYMHGTYDYHSLGQRVNAYLNWEDTDG